jgi:hypothetical protein
MSWAALASSKFKDSDIWCGNAGAPAPPDCLPTSLTGGGNNLRASVIGLAWGTGCLNTTTGKFIFPRLGGHADWAGNQVVSFDATASPDFWSLDKNYSTAYTPMAPTGSFLYKYGTNDPASVHSYGAVCWMPTVSRVWSGGGIYWSPGGSSTPQVGFWWDPAGLTWTEKATRPGGYGCVTGWDSVGSRMILRLAAGVWAYDPTLENGGPNAGAYTQLFAQSAGTVASSMLAIDAPNRKTYRIEKNVGLRMIDFNNLGAHERTLTTTGDTAINGATAPGLLYVDNRLVALGPSSVAGRFAVYTATVEGHGLPGQDPVQWVRDPVDANEPAVGIAIHNGIWANFFGPIGGKYYFVNNDNDDQLVGEYTPTWTATTHTVNEVSDVAVEVLA